MNNIEKTATRPGFFPNSRSPKTNKALKPITAPLKRNSQGRKNELEQMAKEDTKVNIPATVKDFSRIKKAVDRAPAIDNTEKIASLKEQINSGTYNIDYDALADKLLQEEMI